MLIVACRLMTSGDSGVSFAGSSVLRSCVHKSETAQHGPTPTDGAHLCTAALLPRPRLTCSLNPFALDMAAAFTAIRALRLYLQGPPWVLGALGG